MTILDTFYLLFKSDAGNVKTDMAAMEKQIDALREKGKKRSEQENKDLKELIARQKELTDSVKDSQKETDKFVNSIADATAALVGFAAVRSGITKSSSFNSDLKVQSELLQQSARDLKVYGAAAEAAGGSKEGMLATISAWYNGAIAAGITNPGKFSDWTANLQKRLALAPDVGAKNQIIDSLGLPIDPGFRRELLNPEEFRKQIASAEANVGANDKDFDTARETQSHLSHIGQTLDNIWTKISTWAGPTVSGIVQSPVGRIAEDLVGLKLLSYVGKKLLGGGAATAAGEVGTAGAIGLAATIASYLAVVGVGVAIPHYAPQGGRWLGRQINKLRGVGDENGIPPWDPAYNGGSSSPAGNLTRGGGSSSPAGNLTRGLRNNNPGNLSSWQGAGSDGGFAVFATPAAGIHAASSNLEAYGKRGWNTLESIAAHWAPSSENDTGAYIRALEKSTGFGRGDKLDLSDPAVREKVIKGIIQQENGSNPFSDSELMNSISAGKSSLSAATSYGSPATTNKSVTIKIDKIEVQTKATDAAGIAQGVGEHLSSVLGYIAADSDDGVFA